MRLLKRLLSDNALLQPAKQFFIETYGCQMNFNDTEIVTSILQTANFSQTKEIEHADIVLLMTCAIRENAESKIWNRLHQLKSLKEKSKQFKVGVLGCMAERLKTKFLEEDKLVDLVCGPDAYRNIPKMLRSLTNRTTAVDVMLSMDETYADIAPVQIDPENVSAYVSIMRGCENMCSFCIVPFVRGKERSRPMDSILDHVRKLSDQGIKQITLLGQNVNSYRDLSTESEVFATENSPGFKTIYTPKIGGTRFTELLDKVSLIDPDIRISFTSPHPKDFPDDLIHLIAERKNICKQVHLPAQSGSSKVLESMRRGYTREAYMALIDRVKSIIPDVFLSTDLIAGFCGETDQDHQDTISLIRYAKFDTAYMFAYSMREKTHAHRTMVDDVPEQIKQARLAEIIRVFQEESRPRLLSMIGTVQTVLIEGTSKKNGDEFIGRTDGGVAIIIPKGGLIKGSYANVLVTGSTGKTLIGISA